MKDDSEVFVRWFVAKAPLPVFVVNGEGRSKRDERGEREPNDSHHPSTRA